MKNHSASTAAPSAPCEAAIRDYAFHLYEQSGCVPGRDLDNWLAASASLQAHVAPLASTPNGAETTPGFAASEPGNVHSAAGHARGVKEKTAHTNSHRHS